MLALILAGTGGVSAQGLGDDDFPELDEAPDVEEVRAPTAAPPELADLPPDGTPITALRIEGLNRLSPDDLLRVMELDQGGAFYRAALRRDQQALSQFARIDPLSIRLTVESRDERGVALLLTVRENPVVVRMQSIGHIKYSEKAILAQVDFQVGDILPNDARSRTIQSIREFYNRAGYKSARVDVGIDEVDPKSNTVSVTINIDEGERIRIRDLRITGNRAFSAFRLRLRLINTGSWFVFDNYYDDRAFDDDLRVIESFYRDRGFLDARARRGRFEYNAEKAWVSPTIEIEEGPRYTVSDIELRGATLFTGGEVREPFRRVEGQPYSARRLQRAIEAVRTLYGNQGYANAEITARFEKDAPARTMRLIITIRENGVVTIGTISAELARYEPTIELNLLQRAVDHFSPATKDNTILREVRLQTGAKYRTRDEKRTINRLKALGFIRKARVRREPTAEVGVENVVIEVEEDPSAGFFAVSAGLAAVSGPSVSLSYVNPNLFGDGDRFTASTTFARRTRGFRVAYLDRYIGMSDWSYEAAIYRDQDLYRIYRQRVYGVTNEFGHPLGEYTTASGRARLEHTNFDLIVGDPRERFDSYITAAGRGLVEQDRTDDRRFPTRGYRINAGAEAGVADGLLLKATHAYARYFPLWRELVYMYQHGVGLMPYDATRIGLNERFFAGGSSDLRGFAPREVGPRDPDERRLAIGGSTKVSQRHELRYPFAPFLWGRIFTDAAILQRAPLSSATPRVGVGPGITADLGPVTIELDLGLAVVRNERDRLRLLSFRIGSRF